MVVVVVVVVVGVWGASPVFRAEGVDRKVEGSQSCMELRLPPSQTLTLRRGRGSWGTPKDSGVFARNFTEGALGGALVLGCVRGRPAYTQVPTPAKAGAAAIYGLYSGACTARASEPLSFPFSLSLCCRLLFSSVSFFRICLRCQENGSAHA